MNFVLLGGLGYVGGRLTDHLQRQGHRVCVTTRRLPRTLPSWWRADKIRHSDLMNPVTLAPLLDGQNAVVHLAAPDELAVVRSPREALRAGGEKTWCVMEALARCARPPLLLYLSTIHVYGSCAKGVIRESEMPRPTHPYGLGRYLGECVVRTFAQQRNIRTLCIRMSNAFGAPIHIGVPRWSLLVGDLCLQAVRMGKIILRSDGTQRRNFITLHDAVRAIEFLAQRPEKWPADGLIHLGSPLNLSVRKMAKHVARVAGEVLGNEPPIVVGRRNDGDYGFRRLSIERLKGLGFQWENPVKREIEDTLRLCREGQRQRGDSLWSVCRPDLAAETSLMRGRR